MSGIKEGGEGFRWDDILWVWFYPILPPPVPSGHMKYIMHFAANNTYLYAQGRAWQINWFDRIDNINYSLCYYQTW